MTETIFSPSFGNRPSYLVGRETVISTFISGLEQEPGNRDRAMLMLGQRGSGKTVLLWELADRARKLGFVEKIQEAGKPYVNKRRLPKLASGSLSVFGLSAGLEFTRDVQETKSFQFKLTQLARKLTEQGHGILILIDELQANSPEIRQLVTAYQELVGERLNVALVMAGSSHFRSEMSIPITSGLSMSSALIFQAIFASVPLAQPKARPICCNSSAITSPIAAGQANVRRKG